MAMSRSHAHIDLIINGHRFSGYAAEDQPYEIEWPELRSGDTGADGGTYDTAIAAFGCTLTIRLAGPSPSMQWAIQQRTLHQNAVQMRTALPTYEGSITDVGMGISGTFRGGRITGSFPGFLGAAGQTNEIMFQFDLWTPSVDGGNFQAPLAA